MLGMNKDYSTVNRRITTIESITFFLVAFLQQVSNKWSSVSEALKNCINKAAAQKIVKLKKLGDQRNRAMKKNFSYLFPQFISPQGA